jgi:hypothetical protein
MMPYKVDEVTISCGCGCGCGCDMVLVDNCHEMDDELTGWSSIFSTRFLLLSSSNSAELLSLLK